MPILKASGLCAKSPAYRVIAVDLRGHGATTVTPEADLSKATLCADVTAVIKAVVPDGASVCLMGHSMGGAIAVHVAASDAIVNLCGLVVVDVVEGSAVEALGKMKKAIRARPPGFTTVEEAIQWGLSSGQVRNPGSAIISMPPQVHDPRPLLIPFLPPPIPLGSRRRKHMLLVIHRVVPPERCAPRWPLGLVAAAAC